MVTLQRVARENGKPMPLGKLVDVVAEVIDSISIIIVIKLNAVNVFCILISIHCSCFVSDVGHLFG